MSIHTYIYDHEVVKWSHVSDKELDKLYQEVRALSGNRILLQEKEVVIKKFMRKPLIKVLYTLYNYTGCMDAQIINFKQDHEWSINTDVTSSYIYAYFYGYFNGHHQGQAYHLANTNSKP